MGNLYIYVVHKVAHTYKSCSKKNKNWKYFLIFFFLNLNNKQSRILLEQLKKVQREPSQLAYMGKFLSSVNNTMICEKINPHIIMLLVENNKKYYSLCIRVFLPAAILYKWSKYYHRRVPTACCMQLFLQSS